MGGAPCEAGDKGPQIRTQRNLTYGWPCCKTEVENQEGLGTSQIREQVKGGMGIGT